MGESVTNHSPRATTPIFPVRDLDVATHFYRSLDFEVDEYRDGGYAWVMSPMGEVLHLVVTESLDPGANHSAAYFHVEDAHEWHSNWAAAGVAVSALEVKQWGMREFSMHDPDGNLIRVGQNI